VAASVKRPCRRVVDRVTDYFRSPRRAGPLFGQTGPGAVETHTTTPCSAGATANSSPPITAISPANDRPLVEAEVLELVPTLSFLIVDDVRCSSDVLCSLLRSLGAKSKKLYTANTLFGAMNIIRGHHVDVVISDLHLRMGTGLDLLEAIRSGSFNQNADFMLVTNDPAADNIQRAQTLGITAVVIKPLSVAKLVEHLSYCLMKRGLGRG
jgi:CheY-like chemotaxis protein